MKYIIILFFLTWMAIYDHISGVIGGADIKIIATLFVVLSFEIAAKILVLSAVIIIAYGLYQMDFSRKAPYFVVVWAAAVSISLFS